MEIRRWRMEILKILLRKLRELERANVDVESLPEMDWWRIGGDVLARRMYERGVKFFRHGLIWKKTMPHKVTGEFLIVGGSNLMNQATLNALKSRDYDWNPMPDLQYLAELYCGDTMPIRSKKDAKIARGFKVRGGWEGSIDLQIPMTEELAEILAIFQV